MTREKIILTEKQQKYLITNFRNTKNEILANTLGISNGTLHRFARELGLKKTKQFMNKCLRYTTSRAKEENEKSGYRVQRECAKAQWQEHIKNGTMPKSCFQKGDNNLKRIGPKREKIRLQKTQTKRNETIARDRRRVRLGLPPLTKLIKECNISSVQSSLRHNMKAKHAYITFRTDVDYVYYDSSTHRSPIMERHAKALGMFILPIAKRGTTCYNTAITGTSASWSDL